MNQLAQIADIIEEILNDNHVENADVIAEELAAKLLMASLQQLSTVLGSDLDVNEQGETVLNLGSLL
jgi:hypothetical protein|tara:strand:- start:23 stop:223 length:201 start_codon:yes stop_codon:yes gene_type:complete